VPGDIKLGGLHNRHIRRSRPWDLGDAREDKTRDGTGHFGHHSSYAGGQTVPYSQLHGGYPYPHNPFSPSTHYPTNPHPANPYLANPYPTNPYPANPYPANPPLIPSYGPFPRFQPQPHVNTPYSVESEVEKIKKELNIFKMEHKARRQ